MRFYILTLCSGLFFMCCSSNQEFSLKLTFITSNPHKADYLRTYLEIPVQFCSLEIQEVQSLDLNEIVQDKARKAYALLKEPVLVEDVSLSFHALNGLPGPFIKWFLDSMGNEKLCRLLDAFQDKTATAEVEYALCINEVVYTFKGRKLEGIIADHPRGALGFGWSPIFIPKGYSKTLGEMTDEERQEVSMRKPALEQIAKFLELHNN